jgi:isoleucyl-tRNA synthetase
MSFTAEEVWQYLPKDGGRCAGVHLSCFYRDEEILGAASAPQLNREEVAAQRVVWFNLREVRDQVLKALEEARNNKLIGTGLEAQVILTAADPAYSVLKRYADQLRYLFIVSAVTLQQGSGNGTGGVHVEVRKADGAKCERCWNYSTRVGEDKTYPTVCERCSAVLKELEAGN